MPKQSPQDAHEQLIRAWKQFCIRLALIRKRTEEHAQRLQTK